MRVWYNVPSFQPTNRKNFLMTIETTIGDMIADAKGGSTTPKFYVHGCNAQGRMGSGIAKIIRDEWDVVYDDYRFVYQTHGLNVGDGIIVEVLPNVYIVNAVTQEFYRGFVKPDGEKCPNDMLFVDYDAISKVFSDLSDAIITEFVGEAEIHFPLIGAGLANGDWEIIKKRIDEAVDDRIKKVLWKLP